jgi:methionyl-tRNA formyltransferase
VPKIAIAFMGTAPFGLPALEALIAAGHHVACVYTRAPKPAGRGQSVRKTPIHQAAERLGIPVRTPKTLKDPAEQAAFRDLGLDAAVVAAYGLLLPKPVLDAPGLGCLNIHGSLLPRWRGAAPIERAVLAGDESSGVTIMQVDAGLDTGPMLLAESCAIDGLTAGELHDRLAALGAKLIVPALEGVAAGTLTPRPQPSEGATYANKIAPEEARLDWREPATALERRVRAFAPRPGAWFTHHGQRIKVYAAEAVETTRTGEAGISPGTVLGERLLVKCGEGALQLCVLQREGKGKMVAADLLRGFPIPGGTRFDADPA